MGLLGMLLVCVAAAAQDDLRVLQEPLDGGKTGDMMTRYLQHRIEEAQTTWRADFEQRRTPEAIAEYQQRIRARFVEALGGFPERTPLNAQVTGTVQRDGYRVEKIVFESLPQFYVTGALFLPDPARFQPPYPGVLVPCGHGAPAKAYETYQSMGASLAHHGMVALVFDPIDQGERAQWLDENRKAPLWGVQAHTMLGVGCILLGQNTARYEIWDGMRGIDYLVSRPEVDPERIGCTGNSGGGTQTAYLMALDDRIKAAAPSCYLHTMAWQLSEATGDAEQNIFGQLAFGMDMPDYVMMRAPVPIKMLTATHDFFRIEGAWECFRYAKRLYSRMGYSERVDLLENDAGHNYNQLQREAGLRWLARWLQGKDEALKEPTIQLVPETELNATPEGQVLLLPGARSAYDLNIETETKLAEQRRALWANTPREEMMTRVRRLAGIRPLEDLPEPKVERMGSLAREGYTVEKLLLKPEDGIYLPGLLFRPAQVLGAPVLYLDGKGMQTAAEAIEQLVRQGRPVLAVDVRGLGETEQKEQNTNKQGPLVGFDWEDFYKAYDLGLTYVGMRAEDVLTAARFLRQREQGAQVETIAIGVAGVPALHAAALEPDLFGAVRIERVLVSWSDVIQKRQSVQQLTGTVHGALTTYDLPDLVASLGGKIVVVQPLDAQGKEVPAGS